MGTRAGIALWAACLGGCGLVLDLQEPDPDAGPPPGMDAQVSPSDAGTFDAAADATAPPVECAADADCVDEDACTSAERCVDGFCVEDRLACDDGIPCTVDRCDPVEGCTSSPEDDLCGAAVPPLDDCRVPRCDRALGCQLEPSDAKCDDGFACTHDVCGRDGLCTHDADDGRCALSVGMTSVCDPLNGGAAGSGCTPVACDGPADCALAPTDCVLGGVCVDNVCQPQHAGNDTSCDDGLFCTMASSCQSGICVGSMRRSCDDGNACTVDSCLESSEGHVCGNVPDDARIGLPCDDGAPCTEPGQCAVDGTCTRGASTCNHDAAICAVATCFSTGDCSIRHPCVDEHRVCVAGGCGACLPGFADCDERGGCECPLAFARCLGVQCLNVVSMDGSVVGPRDAAILDGALPEGGIRDAAPRDASREGGIRDAASDAL